MFSDTSTVSSDNKSHVTDGDLENAEVTPEVKEVKEVKVKQAEETPSKPADSPVNGPTCSKNVEVALEEVGFSSVFFFTLILS